MIAARGALSLLQSRAELEILRLSEVKFCGALR